jgi:hypothetical protein
MLLGCPEIDDRTYPEAPTWRPAGMTDAKEK